jgi:hypothetical protein
MGSWDTPHVTTIIESNLFQTKVKKIITESINIKDLLREMHLDNIISQAKEDMRTVARKTIDDMARDKVEAHLLRILNDRLTAALVAQEPKILEKCSRFLKAEAETFIQNNAVIQSMLGSHHNSLKKMFDTELDETKQAVQDTIRGKLSEIVQEGQYQVVNTALVETLNQRMLTVLNSHIEAVKEQNTKELKQLHAMEENIRNATTLYASLEKKIDNLSGCLDRFKDKQKNNLEYLGTRNDYNFWWLVGLTAVTGVVLYQMCVK